MDVHEDFGTNVDKNWRHVSSFDSVLGRLMVGFGSQGLHVNSAIPHGTRHDYHITLSRKVKTTKKIYLGIMLTFVLPEGDRGVLASQADLLLLLREVESIASYLCKTTLICISNLDSLYGVCT